MSDTSLNKIIQYGTTADRVAFIPDPASGSQVLYIWFDTDNAPDTYVWDGSAWVQINPTVSGGITELTGDVTAGPGTGSQAATIAALAVTTGKINTGAVTTAKIAAGAVTTTELGALAVTTAKIAAANVTATELASNAVTTAKITNSNVTYAKVQDVSATSRILGRKSSGAGVIEELTLSDILDFLGSAAQGDILFRSASGWSYLAPGTSGNFLKTNGAGADPAWASASGGSGAPWSLVNSGTPSGTTYDVNGLAGYTDIRVFCKQVVQASPGGFLGLRISTDNGSTFLATTSDYIAILGNGSEQGKTELAFHDSSTTSARTSEILIEGINQTTGPKVSRNTLFNTDGQMLRYMPTTSAVNAIRVFSSGGGALSSGVIYVFGRQ